MPPWGRPPGGRGVGRLREEGEDVYRFQELESDDEKNGVMVDHGLQQVPNSKTFNPDELFFSDMDIRAWERRAAAMDGMAYGDDFGYPEDEGYYEDAADITMSAAEYEELIFQRVLDKIRLARATGDPDVQLTEEELEVYQNRLSRQRAPAARPTQRARPIGAPVTNMPPVQAPAHPPSHAGASASGSGRSKKSQQRASIFASRPKKEKPSSRKRAPSNVSDAPSNSQPPGFVVPGPGGQPVYAPINAYQSRMTRDAPVRPSVSPSRHGSRSASIGSMHQEKTPPRITPPREIPGAFPGSPQRYRALTPPRRGRPPSSSSRQATHDSMESLEPRNASSSGQQSAKLTPFPVTDYQHYTAEPYQYHNPTQSQPSQSSSSHPQYSRKPASGSSDSYMTMPRRVPVSSQRAVPAASYSDPALRPRGSGSSSRADVSEEDGRGGVVVDVRPTEERSSRAKSSAKEGSSGGSGRDGGRKRRSKKKN